MVLVAAGDAWHRIETQHIQAPSHLHVDTSNDLLSCFALADVTRQNPDAPIVDDSGYDHTGPHQAEAAQIIQEASEVVLQEATDVKEEVLDVKEEVLQEATDSANAGASCDLRLTSSGVGTRAADFHLGGSNGDDSKIDARMFVHQIDEVAEGSFPDIDRERDLEHAETSTTCSSKVDPALQTYESPWQSPKLSFIEVQESLQDDELAFPIDFSMDLSQESLFEVGGCLSNGYLSADANQNHGRLSPRDETPQQIPWESEKDSLLEDDQEHPAQKDEIVHLHESDRSISTGEDVDIIASSHCLDEDNASANISGHQSSSCGYSGSVQRQEKFIFLVRHAQSRWNVQLENVSKYPQIARNPAQAGAVINGVAALTKDIGQGLFMHGCTDHPCSSKGEEQAQALRRAIGQEQEHDKEVKKKNKEASGRLESESSYYQRFLHCLHNQFPIYCSPMLRALQTAHLALPVDVGWGPIVLLKDAREVLSTRAERDCVGEAEGEDIVKRAMDVCELPGLSDRVDWEKSDCQGQWWSSDAENEEGINERMHALVQRLLEEDQRSSCICVTHSNFIRRFMMRYGAVRSCTEVCVDKGLSMSSGELRESTDSWEVVEDSSRLIQRTKVDKLQNCGVLGVCFSFEDDQWNVRDVCLMFDSQFESDLDLSE